MIVWETYEPFLIRFLLNIGCDHVDYQQWLPDIQGYNHTIPIRFFEGHAKYKYEFTEAGRWLAFCQKKFTESGKESLKDGP